MPPEKCHFQVNQFPNFGRVLQKESHKNKTIFASRQLYKGGPGKKHICIYIYIHMSIHIKCISQQKNNNNNNNNKINHKQSVMILLCITMVGTPASQAQPLGTSVPVACAGHFTAVQPSL